LEHLKGKRDRVRKKDLEEQATTGKGAAKGKAPAKADAKKGGKGAPAASVDKGAAEEDSVEIRVVPQPGDHQNVGIKAFLDHFSQPRLIHVKSQGMHENRKRDDPEIEEINAKRQAQRDTETEKQDVHVEERNSLKESREVFKQKILDRVDNERTDYKDSLQTSMDNRTEFRDAIVLRKEKEKALTDLLTNEKIDLAALT